MLGRMRFAPWIIAVAVTGLAVTAAASGADSSTAPAHVDGIWKTVVPPKAMKGEFDNMDPMGVAAGAKITADCSLNWIDPDDGRLYCFVSGTSLEFFLDQPQLHLQRARAAWRKLSAASN